MSLPKVTLDGVEFTLVPAGGCSANEIGCFFLATSIKSCEPRIKLCDGGTPETQVVFLDNAGLLKHLTARLTK